MPRARAHRSWLVAALAALAVAVVPAGAAVANPAPGGGGATQIPVSFRVKLLNQSGVPCVEVPPPAGQEVTVRGHITGPAGKVATGQKIDGGLYSHGDGYDERFWIAPGGFSVAGDLAGRQGSTSVTIDRLGYGASDKPNGNGVCYGTEATVLHQIVEQLRAGTYQADKRPTFGRIALVGHSASGFVIEQEAAAFHDVQALGVISSGELSVTPRTLQRATEQQQRCANPATSPNGYAGLEANDQQFRDDHIFNVEEPVARALIANRTKDACAGTRNVQALVANPARNATIKLPVLLLTGANDAFFPNIERQAPTYAGSQVTQRKIPQTGHAIAFGRTAPQFRSELAAWLKGNRF